MEEKNTPNYFGILPANVRYDKKLKPMEKILYTEITALANSKGYCYATNSYFANLYDVHKNTVGTWINKLEKLGYLKSKIIYEKGTKNIKERQLFIVDPINKNIDTYQQKDCNPINEKIDTPINEKIDTPINEKIEDNNTRYNNTRYNNKKEINKEKNVTENLLDYIETLEIDSEKKKIFKEWVEYKKEKNQYKNTKSIDILIKRFVKYSVQELRDIVEKSIMNNYSGIFEPKEGVNNGNSYNTRYSRKQEDRHSKKPDYTKGFDDWN